MPISFGELKSKAKYYEPDTQDRDVKVDIRSPFALDGELAVVGGRGGRDVIVVLHISLKSRDAVMSEVNACVSQEGKLGTLTLTPEGGGGVVYNDCFLRSVIPGKVRPLAYDSEINGPSFLAEPTLVFRQMSVPNTQPTAGGAFGK